nr:pectinesterase inhibitor [Tanacetum cinerariifolium]
EKTIEDGLGPCYKKLATLEEGVLKMMRKLMEEKKEDNMGACIEKLDKVGWAAQDPMYDTALLLFGQSADYRKLWLHLKPESCGNWVKSVGSKVVDAPDMDVESSNTSLDNCDLNVLQEMKSNEVKDVSLRIFSTMAGKLGAMANGTIFSGAKGYGTICGVKGILVPYGFLLMWHTVTSSSFTNLSSEAEPEFIELSLGVKAPVTTSSIIDHSRLLKRKRLSQHQELVNATRSFTLYLSPSDSAPVTTSNLFIDYSAMPICFIPPQDPPKKSTYPTSTQPIEEPQNKKRKITPKIKSGPVVKNEVTERLQKFITCDEMNGSEPKLVIQKVLYMSYLKQYQNRLSLPLKNLETEDFLTIEEKLALENENEIEVRLVGPTLKMYKEPMSSVKGSNLSSSSSQENERRVDEEKKALGPLLDEAKEEFGPISSWDFKEVQEAFGPISVGTREGFGPISSLDLEKVEEAFGPISNDTKEAFGSISSSMLHEAKEALGPISPATLEEAKEAFTEKAQE